MSVKCAEGILAEESLPAATGPVPEDSPLHRLHEARRQEGLSCRAIARRLCLTVAEVRRQELATTDIPLSMLHRWREALDVPLIELLQEPELDLSPAIMWRAQMVRVMKTAKYILRQAKRAPVKRMAQALVDQLIEVMPELRDVDPWHRLGRRRRLDEFGRAAEVPFSSELFLDPEG